MKYDIIGDIHGCHKSLIGLLENLGYQNTSTGYSHPSRQVIFLGDFIDRGPGQREVLGIVRPMVASGAAMAVMGNHEFNAIAYHEKDPATGDHLRPHTIRNARQHRAFLDCYTDDASAYADVIAWFKTLPLWLDLGDIRVIHACWDSGWIQRIQDMQAGSNRLHPELLNKAARAGTWQYEAVETLLKGKEIPLKDGLSFKDKDGNLRHHIRIRWWDKTANSYQKLFIGPESARTAIPDDDIDGDHLIEYGHDQPPCFLGHYWLEGQPGPLATNIACLDYSVAKRGGRLAAYRWDGERVLSENKFVWVDRVERD